MNTTTQQTATATQTAFLFPNLFKAIIDEHLKQLETFKAELLKQDDVWKILDSWYYSELLTKGKKRVVWALADLQAYLIDRKTKAINKAIEAKRKYLETVSAAGEIINIDISVEWKRSSTWGANPTAQADTRTSKGFDRYTSGSIGGCGYDKQSTAIAKAMNQSNEFLKALYLVKEQQPTAKNADIFGYGSGYGMLPRLEGGMGVSYYPSIFAKIGLNWRNVASGKSYDAYTVTKA